MNVPESIPYIILVGVSAILWLDFLHARRARREQHIREFSLPPGLFDKLRSHHPHLTQKDCQLVAQGLRQFFMTFLKSGRQFVSMPSQVVDGSSSAEPYCGSDLGHTSTGCGGGSDGCSDWGDGSGDGGGDGGSSCGGGDGGSNCGGGGGD